MKKTVKMKRKAEKIILSSVLAGTLAAGIALQEASAGEFTGTQLKKIGVFLSNFTECSFTSISRGNFIDHPDEMVKFAMCHNWINTKRYRLTKKCGKESSKYNNFVQLDPKYVAETVKKYLDYDFREHQGYGDYITYDGHTYCMPAASGEQTPHVKAVSAQMMDDGTILVRGSSYYPDAETYADDNINVKAVIRPYVWNGNSTWSLVKLEMEEKPFPH